MLNQLKQSLDVLEAEIKQKREVRKDLKRLIKRVEQGNLEKAGPQQKIEPLKAPASMPHEIAEKPSKKVQSEIKTETFEIPFKGHSFLYYHETIVDKQGVEHPGRGWLSVHTGQENRFYEGCRIQVFDENDVQIIKNGAKIFEVIEDCQITSTGVKVKILL